MGVTPRPAAAVFGNSIVRTKLPLVVISSTYSGLVFCAVTPVVYTNVLPVSSPMRTTARLPPVNGTGAVVGAGVVEREDVGVLVIEGVDVTVLLIEGVDVTVLVAVFVDVTVLVAVLDDVCVLDPVKLDDGEAVLELVEDVVSAGVGVVDGVVPGGREADEEAVALAEEVIVRAAVIDALEVLVAVCDCVLAGVAVAVAVAIAGANATLWYSTLADEAPRIEVHTPVNESYRTTWLPEYKGVTVVVYSTNRPVTPSGYSN